MTCRCVNLAESKTFIINVQRYDYCWKRAHSLRDRRRRTGREWLPRYRRDSCCRGCAEGFAAEEVAKRCLEDYYRGIEYRAREAGFVCDSSISLRTFDSHAETKYSGQCGSSAAARIYF